MNRNTGSRKQNQFLPTPGMKTGRRYMIQNCRHMTQKTGRKLHSIGFPFLMKTEYRKLGSGKGKERNTSGRRSTFRQTTGTTGRMRNGGEHPGQNIVTNIWIRRSRSIIALMRGREWTERRRSMKASQPGTWRKTADHLSDVRQTGKSGNGIPFVNRSGNWLRISQA